MNRWVLVLSLIKWESLFQRPQQIASHFPESWKVLFVEPATLGEPNAWKPVPIPCGFRLSLQQLPHYAKKPTLRKLANLVGTAPVRRTLDAWGGKRLMKAIRRLRITELSGILLQNPQMVPWLDLFPGPPVVLDLMDDIFAFSGTPHYLKDLLARGAARARAITVTAPDLKRLVPREEPKTLVLGNGVDFEHFAAGARQPEPEALRAIPRPRILYAGSLAYWVDFGLLAKIAVGFPEATLVLCGPVYEDMRTEMERLKSRPNVLYLGTIPYPQLPAYMGHASLGLIPFVRSQLTEAVNPNKLYEYGAAEVPVIAVATAEIRRVAPSLPVAENHEEFLALIRRCLTGEREAFLTTELARLHSWKAVAEKIAEFLGEDSHGGTGARRNTKKL